jgi:hypothetical protein
MRALRVVGIGESGVVVLEDPERRERFTVVADERLQAAARGDVTRLGQIAIEVDSTMRPREIQARIRAGASVDQLAEIAGMPVDRIERFAYPVLLERSRTAELARGAHPVRASGPDDRKLGEVVEETFTLRGLDYADSDWDSWRGEDGKWIVALGWQAGRSDNRAHWSYQPGAGGGTVTALDEHAADLVEGLPARPLRTVGPVIDLESGGRAEAPAGATEDPSGDPAAPDAAEAPAGAGERPADPGKPTAGTTQGAASTPGAPGAAESPAPTGTTGSGGSAGAKARRDRRGKPVVPSWEDVLLGVRGQR